MKKYKLSQEKLNDAYRAYYRTDNTPNSSVNTLLTACASMIISAYEMGQHGEPLSDLLPWIVEA